MIGVWIGEGHNRKEIESKFQYEERIVFFAEEVNTGELLEIISNQGLFRSKKLFVLHGFLGVSDVSSWFFKNIEIMFQSGHCFVLYEDKVLSPVLKKLTDAKIPVEKETTKTIQKTYSNEVFAITDALLRRDRKIAWVAYQRALKANKSAEEIIGLLWWQIKSLWLVSSMGPKSGLKPFVYNKNKKALEKYSKREIRKLAKDIVDIYHESRLGKYTLEHGCEKLLLSL